MRTLVATLFALGAAAAVASADDSPPQPRLHGQVTSEGTGLPVAGATVFIATGSGLEQTVTTDDHGAYQAELYTRGTYNLIYAFGSSRISRHVDLATRTDVGLDVSLDDGGEVISVEGHLAPPVSPVPVKDWTILPRYSETAALGNYWSKAWLLLDVDATGTVTRVKFLKRPGHDLDPIAVETALATQFTPARDASGNPTRTLLVWPIEWPSYWWLVRRVGVTTRIPDYAHHVKCIGSGPLNLDSVMAVQRDCSEPDLSKAASEPWIKK